MAQPCCKSNKTRQQTTTTKIHELAIVFDCYLSVTVMKIEAERSESQGHPQLHREFISSSSASIHLPPSQQRGCIPSMSSSSGSIHLPLWTPAAWGFLPIHPAMLEKRVPRTSRKRCSTQSSIGLLPLKHHSGLPMAWCRQWGPVCSWQSSQVPDHLVPKMGWVDTPPHPTKYVSMGMLLFGIKVLCR